MNKKRNIPAAAILLSLFLLTGCSLSRTAESAPEVDRSLEAWVAQENTRDAAEVAARLKKIEAQRKAESQSRYEASVAESLSVEASLEASRAEEASLQAKEAYEAYLRQSAYESSVEESESIEASIAASSAAKESYEAVVASVAESITAGGTPSGQLEAGKIVSVGDEAIPQLRQLFEDTVVLGHSQAKNLLDSGILTESTVLYQWAAHMDEITDMVTKAAGLYRSKCLFMMGTNDMGYYMDNTAGWKQDYIKMIELYRSINPDSEIYLQLIIPIPEAYHWRWRNWYRCDTYNALILEICEECGCTAVSVEDFAFSAFIADETGTHFSRDYYFYWTQTVANQMGLWEERP